MDTETNIIKIISIIGAIIGWLVAIANGIYTLWRDFRQKPKVQIYFGDKINIVMNSEMQMPNLHLNCTFVNQTPKVAVVKKIGIEITKGLFSGRLFEWTQFIKYNEDRQAIWASETFPIMINPRSSFMQRIEFHQSDDFKWEIGSYELTVKVWVNRKTNEEPDTKQTIGFDYSEEDKTNMRGTIVGERQAYENNGPYYYPISINYLD